MPGFFGWWNGPATPNVPGFHLNDAGSGSSAPEARKYCPVCEPDTDPIAECVVVNYCGDHVPSTKGDIDPHFDGYLRYDEAGGADNRAVCQFIHRPVDKKG